MLYENDFTQAFMNGILIKLRDGGKTKEEIVELFGFPTDPASCAHLFRYLSGLYNRYDMLIEALGKDKNLGIGIPKDELYHVGGK